MPQELLIAGRFALALAPVGRGYALAAVTHVASGTRLLEQPINLFEVEHRGNWVGSRELATEVAAGTAPPAGGRGLTAAHLTFGDETIDRQKTFWKTQPSPLLVEGTLDSRTLSDCL